MRKSKKRGLQTAWLEESSAPSNQMPLYSFSSMCPDTPERCAQLDHFNKHGVAVRRFCVECSRASPLAARPGIRRTVSRSTTLKFESRRPKGHRRVVLIGHDLGGPHACTWHLAGRTAQSPIVINARRPPWRRIWSSVRQMRKSWYIALFQLPWVSNWYTKKTKRAWSSKLIARVESKIPVTNLRIEPFLEHYRQGFETCRGFEKGEKITAPTLVLWGEKDAFLEVPTVAELLTSPLTP